MMHTTLVQRKSYKEWELSQVEVSTVSFKAKCFENVHEILGIKLKPGVEEKVKAELKRAPEVAAVYVALGEYDIIALLNIEDSRDLTHFVTEKVRKMKGVIDAHTVLIKK